MNRLTQLILISNNETIINAMRILDKTAKRILFVVNDEVLVGSLTDGDIRRWIINNGDLNANVMKVANKNPIYLYDGCKDSALSLLNEEQINAIPVLDSCNRIIDIIFRDEFVCIAKEKIKEKKMPVVIMAGGLGTRLYPYTKILPKPLIPIGDTPIIERIMHEFGRYGFNMFDVVVNYKKDMIKSYFKDCRLDYNICFFDEDKPLGTAGGLCLLKNALKTTFVLTNCDVLIRENIDNIIEEHISQGNKVTMVCSAKEFVIPYGIVELDKSGQIENMKEKPSMSFLTNTGCYIVEPEVVELIKDGENIGFPDVVKRCKDAGMRVGIYPISEESWYDMGQLNELQRMEQLFINNG